MKILFSLPLFFLTYAIDAESKNHRIHDCKIHEEEFVDHICDNINEIDVCDECACDPCNPDSCRILMNLPSTPLFFNLQPSGRLVEFNTLMFNTSPITLDPNPHAKIGFRTTTTNITFNLSITLMNVERDFQLVVTITDKNDKNIIIFINPTIMGNELSFTLTRAVDIKFASFSLNKVGAGIANMIVSGFLNIIYN